MTYFLIPKKISGEMKGRKKQQQQQRRSRSKNEKEWKEINVVKCLIV